MEFQLPKNMQDKFRTIKNIYIEKPTHPITTTTARSLLFAPPQTRIYSIQRWLR